MNSFLQIKSELTTQEPTPHSSHIFAPNQKPFDFQQITAVSRSEQCIRVSITPENNRPCSPTKTNKSQIISDGPLSKDTLQITPNKREVNIWGQESGTWTMNSSKCEGTPTRTQAFYNKEVIRQEEEEIRQLKKWVDVLKKQCNIYEQVINKMDQKMTSLIQENKQLEEALKERNIDNQNLKECLKIKDLASTKKLEQVQYHKNEMSVLKQKINKVMEMYGSLQSCYHKGQIEWEVFKQKWNHQKKYYLQQISYLKTILQQNKEHKNYTYPDRAQLAEISYKQSKYQNVEERRSCHGSREKYGTKESSHRNWSPNTGDGEYRTKNNTQYGLSTYKY